MLPKALGLDISVKKGDFPHLYNLPENYDYIGKLPDLQYFSIDYMLPEKRQKLINWHNSQSHVTNWNFMEELISYCKNDVEILHQCIMKFRSTFKEITGLDPITRSFTLASIAMETFTTLFLGSGKNLANTPVDGYNKSKLFSISSNCYLDWIEY